MDNKNKKKVGRPPVINPKNHGIAVKLSDEELKILDAYCDEHNASRPEAIREGILRLPDQNYFWTKEWLNEINQSEAALKNGSDKLNQELNKMIEVMKEMAIKSKQGSDKNEDI